MTIQQKLKFPEVLSISLPYLIEKFSIEYILEYKDKNGWNFLHWAIANNDLQKINELLSVGFKFDTLSKNNKIHKKIFKNKKNEYIANKTNIYFIKNGYTPLHLLVFLQSYFSEKVKYVQNDYLNLFSIIVQKDNNLINVKDSQNLSLADYCIILKNIDLLFEISLIDQNLSSLSNVETSYNTLVHMLDYSDPHSKDFLINPKGKFNSLLKKLEVLKNHKNLEQKLVKNLNKKTNNINKI